MIVERIIIHNFKSLAKDCEIKVGKHVTALVGANQSGKTNILRAIEKFSFGEYQSDDICDFSEPAKAKDIDKELPMITVVLRVGDNEKSFTGICPAFSKISELWVTRKYSGEYVFALPGIQWVGPEVNRILIDVDKLIFELIDILNSIGKGWSGADEVLGGVAEEVNALSNSFRPNMEGEVVTVFPKPSVVFEGVKATFEGLLGSLVEVEKQGDGEAVEHGGEESAGKEKGMGSIREDYLRIIKRFEVVIKKYEDIVPTSEEVESRIKSLLPKFIYVSAEHGSLLKGEVNLAELEGAAEEDVQFASIRRLLKLANLGVDELTKIKSPVRRRQRLANAASSVTEILQRVWEQQDIKISLELADTQVLRIYLSSDGGPDRYPEQQSYGFRWYLEFYLGYALAVEGVNQQNVLLLDEPGIHLHPLAQRNLVDVLREMANRNQIIYTTHYLDMLDLENPESWRVVENYESSEIGTCIVNEAYLHRGDHIGFEVITKSLWGASMVPSLWIGPKNLVVEGPSDMILLSTVSRLLGSENMEEAVLVNGEITVIHTGGLSHYRKILTFYNRPGIKLVAFFDSDKEGRKKKSELIKNYIIDGERTVEINDAYSSNGAEERDIENVFGFELIKEAAMQVYGSNLPRGFNFRKGELPSTGGLGRRLKDFFESKGIDEYNKVEVALALKSILLENPNKLTGNSQQRFKELIIKIREAFNQ